jgi:peptidylprolyl isomerase
MKFTLVITALCIGLAVAGCGSGESTASSSGAAQEGSFASISGGEGKAIPKIVPPDRPPPKKLLVRDIKEGSGPAAHRGDEVGVYFYGVNYKTGKEQYKEWPPGSSLNFTLGSGGYGEGWEEGIEGMKLGGRREVIVPSKLLFNTGTVDYVVDLVKLKPAGKASAGG